MLLNNQWITEEIKEEIKKYLNKNNNEDMAIQNLWDTARTILRRKFRVNTILYQETRKISIKEFKLPTIEVREQRPHSAKNKRSEGK